MRIVVSGPGADDVALEDAGDRSIRARVERLTDR